MDRHLLDVLLIGSFIVGPVIVAMALSYVKQMEMIKRRPHVDNQESLQTKQAIESIRKELAELRDTATRYDVSFDSALQRLETRVGRLEESSKPQLQASVESLARLSGQ